MVAGADPRHVRAVGSVRHVSAIPSNGWFSAYYLRIHHQERTPRLTLPVHVAFAWTLLRASFLGDPRLSEVSYEKECTVACLWT